MSKSIIAGICIAIAAAGVFTGCNPSATTSSALAVATSGATYYQEFDHNGRTYIVGSPEMAAKFKQHKHLPYTKTMIGGGDKGQTVIVEVDKKNSAYAEALWAIYKEKNLYYAEEEHGGRIYIIGSPDMHAKFKEHKHLPYTYSKIGEGPSDETVIVEVDKKNPAHQMRLWNEFKENHLFYAEEKHNGRIYVIGKKDTHKSFKANGHLPYTRTLIGKGPDGETLIFEVDKKNPAVADRLMKTWSAKYGAI